MKLKIVPHVNEALKTYASAIGEQYFEAEHAPIQRGSDHPLKELGQNFGGQPARPLHGHRHVRHRRGKAEKRGQESQNDHGQPARQKVVRDHQPADRPEHDQKRRLGGRLRDADLWRSGARDDRRGGWHKGHELRIRHLDSLIGRALSSLKER